MHKNRIIDIDLLRALIIVSAFLIHYNTNIYISFLSIPSIVVQNYIFTVGGFFFFLSGYMARRFYYDKYIQNPKSLSKSIISKGVNIVLLYVAYISIMRVFTNAGIPKNMISFLFDHSFYTKVLFSFGLLYMLTPMYLYFYRNYKKSLIVSMMMFALVTVLYKPEWPVPYSIKFLFLDRNLFLYPMVSSLVIYTIGFLISELEVNQRKEIASLNVVLSAIVIISVHLILCGTFQGYKEVIRNRHIFTFVESITPFMAIIIARFVCRNHAIYHFISRPYIICVGVFSLHFYIISNMLLVLISVTKDSAPVYKILAMIGVCLLSYTFTYWRFLAKQKQIPADSPHLQDQGQSRVYEV